jgi:hypothetical protein
MHSKRTARLSLLAVLGTAAALFLLVGCSTVRNAFMNAALGQNAGETEQAPAAEQPKAAKAPKGPSASSIMAAKYQFTAVYSTMWSVGWYGGKGGGYKPGQGTVWEFTGSKGSSGKGPITVRAGTFTADHIVYTDKGGTYQTESWGSDKVPGGLVKSVHLNLKTKDTSTAELIRIDSGITTELSSY